MRKLLLYSFLALINIQGSFVFSATLSERVTQFYALAEKKKCGSIDELRLLLKKQNLLSSVKIEFDGVVEGKNISPVPFKYGKEKWFFILRFRDDAGIESILYEVDLHQKAENRHQKMLWIMMEFYQFDGGSISLNKSWLNPWSAEGKWEMGSNRK